MVAEYLLLWPYLRLVELTPPGASPASHSFRATVPPPGEGGQPRDMLTTVHLRRVDQGVDDFRLNLPLYGLECRYKYPFGTVEEACWRLAVTPLAEAARLICRMYGINLAAHGALLAACKSGITTFQEIRSGPAEAFAYFGIPGAAERYLRTLSEVPGYFATLDAIPPPARGPLMRYTVYEDVARLVGTLGRRFGIGLEGLHPGRHGPDRPFLDVAVLYPDASTGRDQAEVLFFDGPPLEPVARAPLPGGLSGEPMEQYRRVCAEQARQRRQWQEWCDPLRSNIRGADPDAHEWEKRAFETGQAECVREARKAHLRLVRALRRRRHEVVERQTALVRVRVLRQARERLLADRRETYTHLMAHVRDVLPHMSVLPTGVDVQITPFRDTALGQAALRVQRPGFRPGGEDRRIEVRGTFPDELGLPTLQDAASSVFGGPGSGRNWIFPLGYVGLAKMAQNASAYDRAVNIETRATDFWCQVRPRAAERIRKGGLQDWWSRNGHEGRAADAFLGLMGFLAGVCIPRGERAEDSIHGIIQIGAAGKVAGGGAAVDRVVWRFNPEVARLTTGAGGERPYFMVVNSRAMFSYEKKELHLAPALQLYLEHRTRAAYLRGNLLGTDGELVTANGDGTAFATLAERLGLPGGRRPSETMARLEAALATLAERGVVAGFRRTGPARRNPLEAKVAIRMSRDYLALYDHHRLRRLEQEHRRFLEAPFAPGGRRVAGRMTKAVSKSHP